ncbi:hypothetical protein [Dokdonella soli]|uniref:Spore coat protein U domain-containing protein n=1 Tax=Dokdonella soli TaxID=529810 RepID=A0ABP3TPN1_9GAMM
MNIKLAGALALALGGIVAAATPRVSSAADVAVNVTINNGITILYYYSTLNVTIDASTLGAGIAGCVAGTVAQTLNCDRGASTVAATVTGGQFVAPFTAVTTPMTGLTPAAMPLVLQNVWAVRALGGASANTTVTAAVGTNTTLKNGAASILVNNNIGIATGTAPTLSGGASANVVFPDPGLANPVTGSVIMSLDLTNATTAGTYTGTGAQQYTIAVTAT